MGTQTQRPMTTQPSWECECGALNPERTGRCVGCRLSTPKRIEIAVAEEPVVAVDAAHETFYAHIVGQVIRSSREVRHITMTTMAAAAGLTSSAWSRVETGETTLTVSQLRKASTKLGVEPWTIIQLASRISTQLSERGVVVHDEKPQDVSKLIGGAAILALITSDAEWSPTSAESKR